MERKVVALPRASVAGITTKARIVGARMGKVGKLSQINPRDNTAPAVTGSEGVG